MWTYSLENYSYIALAFGQRQILLSLIGFVLMLALTWCWRRASVQSLLSAWLWFWIWMLPLSLFGSTNPGIGEAYSALHELREFMRQWLPLSALSPCGIPYQERLNTDAAVWLPHKWLLGLWLLLASWKALSLLWQRKKLAAIARHADVVEAEDLLACVEQWRQRYRLRRSVSLRSSAACMQAFTLGVIRPVVYIPDYLLRDLQRSEIDAVLGHELAHIKRYDDIFVCFQLITKSLLFFNPLIWLSARYITLLRERCCDGLAIRVGHFTQHQYAQSLLRIAELQHEASASTRPAISTRRLFDREIAPGLTSSVLAQRVRYILRPGEKHFSCAPLLAAIIILLLLNIVLMPNLSDLNSIRANEAKELLHRLGAVSPMPKLSGDGNFIDNVGSGCGFPKWGHYHPGADFLPGSDSDRAVRAIADGEVVSVSETTPYAGVTLRIRHADSIVSTYTHLSEVVVKPGADVHAGEPVGAIGEGHLHLEIRQGLRAIDPSFLLAQ